LSRDKGTGMTKHISDDELVEELKLRIEQSRKAFSDLSVVNAKLIELNRKLEESEALKSNFLSNIRNEINNPLNSIIGLAQEIAGITEGGEASNLAAMIYSEAANLDFQLRNIFIAAELEAGETVPVPARVEIDAATLDLMDSFRAFAEQKSVHCTAEITDKRDGEPMTFCTDAEKLQIIMSNLIANGIEFNKSGGEVSTEVCIEGSTLVISVKDTGIGMSDADMNKIFDRFVQIETGSMRSYRGHGLGLSVVRSLVDILNGNITVESEPGAGTLFTVTIPELEVNDDEMSFAEAGNMFLFDSMDET